jgi:DNA ligase-1
VGVLQVVGFVPTGWTYEMRKAAKAGGPYPFPVRTKAACSVWLIPYSEHSSFPELLEYVGFLRPKQVRCAVGWEGGYSWTQLHAI